MRFSLGTTVATRGVSDAMDDSPAFRAGVAQAFARHARGDWGEVCDEDKQSNDEALKVGCRLHSAYTVEGKVVWIITESDRSATTALFPDEY